MPDGGVTVVVPTLNRDGMLTACLKDLLAQTHRPLEILVVDQSDQPGEEVAALAQANPEMIRWHRVGFRGLPAARNYGWRHAAHRAVLFVDDDIRCGPSLVAEHWRSLQIPGVGVVGGGIDEARWPDLAAGPPGRFGRWTATPLGGFEAHSEGDAGHARGCNFSAARDALQKGRGFDERFQAGAALYEEADFCLRARRAGYRVYFNGKARLTHLAARDGGCRVPNVVAYVYGLAHNRAILIRRHLCWYHRPTAVGRLALLCLSYAVHYRRPRAFASGARGFVHGWRAALEPVKCGDYS